jgi:hypothetical protein
MTVRELAPIGGAKEVPLPLVPPRTPVRGAGQLSRRGFLRALGVTAALVALPSGLLVRELGWVWHPAGVASYFGGVWTVTSFGIKPNGDGPEAILHRGGFEGRVTFGNAMKALGLRAGDKVEIVL